MHQAEPVFFFSVIWFQCTSQLFDDALSFNNRFWAKRQFTMFRFREQISMVACTDVSGAIVKPYAQPIEHFFAMYFCGE
jgi:hypothetical protein